MAGDWIKFEVATLHKPEVTLAAEYLGISRREMLGVFLDYWAWLDANTGHALVTHVSRKSLESVLQCVGLSAVLELIGWVKFDDERHELTVTNYDRHNGSPAKTRALAKDRKVTQRSRLSHANPVTREEKRREDIKTLTPLSESSSDVVPLRVSEGKPSKLRQDAGTILTFLNERTNHHYRFSDTTLKPIMSRLREGYSIQECKAVIVRKWREWQGDDKMAKYLRPDTLFNATKFAQYIGEVPPDAEVPNVS